MSQALKPIPEPAADEILGRVISTGDLSKLPWIEKIAYYKAVCDSMGLNPLTRPLEYVRLRGRNGQEGREVLYVRKEATDQLRAIHKVSITKVEEVLEGDLFKVTVYGRTADGREDVEIGITSVRNLVGQDLADARMKASTKAKRRLTLSLVGLGIFPEEEEVQMTHHKAPWSGGKVLAEPEKPQPAIAEGKVEEQDAAPAEADAEPADRLTREQLQRINDQIEELKRRGVTNAQFKQTLIDNFGIDMRMNLKQDQADKFIVLCKDWIDELVQNEAERSERS
jgi:hypothetical protein